MVDISVNGDALEIEVRGIHKLWALKSTLRVPLEDIDDIRHDPERAGKAFPGLRFPGTHLPAVYTAGTYYQGDFRPDFWSVRRPDKAVVVQCRPGAAYDEIIVEVDDPGATVARVRAAIAARRA